MKKNKDTLRRSALLSEQDNISGHWPSYLCNKTTK